MKYTRVPRRLAGLYSGELATGGGVGQLLNRTPLVVQRERINDFRIAISVVARVIPAGSSGLKLHRNWVMSA